MGKIQIPGDKLANTSCRYSVHVIQPGGDDDGKRLQAQNQVWKLHTGLVQRVTMLISRYQLCSKLIDKLNLLYKYSLWKGSCQEIFRFAPWQM